MIRPISIALDGYFPGDGFTPKTIASNGFTCDLKIITQESKKIFFAYNDNNKKIINDDEEVFYILHKIFEVIL